jgi:hypothetical protein
VGEIITFDGVRKRVREQVSTPRKPVFAGNKYTRARLFAAVMSADSLDSAARKLGGKPLLLSHLKRELERRGPALLKEAA